MLAFCEFLIRTRYDMLAFCEFSFGLDTTISFGEFSFGPDIITNINNIIITDRPGQIDLLR